MLPGGIRRRISTHEWIQFVKEAGIADPNCLVIPQFGEWQTVDRTLAAEYLSAVPAVMPPADDGEYALAASAGPALIIRNPSDT